MDECEKDTFCARNILNSKPQLVITNEWGQKITYFSFQHATDAMKEYSDVIVRQLNTETRKMLIEKINTKQSVNSQLFRTLSGILNS